VHGQRIHFVGRADSVTGMGRTATLSGTGALNDEVGCTFSVSAVDNAAFGRLKDTSDGPQLLKQGDVHVVPS
jgi:hypothetical protein